ITVVSPGQFVCLFFDGTLTIAGIRVVGEKLQPARPTLRRKFLEKSRHRHRIVPGLRHLMRSRQVRLALRCARELKQHAIGPQSNSMLGRLGQLGIGLGANSVLLKFSRTAESQADLTGSHLMAESGYNPMAMARFFEKLSSQGGSRGLQFFSDHPNPGDRERAIEEEADKLPRRNYGYETGEFGRMKQV